MIRLTLWITRIIRLSIIKPPIITLKVGMTSVIIEGKGKEEKERAGKKEKKIVIRYRLYWIRNDECKPSLAVRKASYAPTTTLQFSP